MDSEAVARVFSQLKLETQPENKGTASKCGASATPALETKNALHPKMSEN